jgi:serine/threonine protein kinase
MISYITGESVSFYEGNWSPVTLQVLDGLQYLHWRGYCHLNLQPDNIVMASVRSVQIKLVDFGFAQRVSKLGTVVDAVGDSDYSG